MNKKLVQQTIILLPLVFWGNIALTQTTIEWSKTYGGNGADRGHCIRQTADGGFIVSGYTDTDNNGDVSGYQGGGDIWVVKLDNSGNLEWQKAYGGSDTEPSTEAYTNIIQTSDGGYLVTGESRSSNGDLTDNHGLFDVWVFKIEADGDLEWQRSIGGGTHEGAYSILQEPDGGFVLIAYTSSADGDVAGHHGMVDGWLIKLSATGNIVWQKAMGGTWTDALTSIRHTGDGGYIVAGYTLSNDGDVAGLNPDGFSGYADYWIAKLNSSREIEWQKVIGGSKEDKARCIVQTSDGGYMVAGTTESNDGDVSEGLGNWDWWVVKLSATGTLEWEKTLGGSKRDEVRSIEATSDGSGYFVVGTTESTDGHVTGNHGGKDIWLVKLDNTGDIILNKCFGGTENEIGFFGIASTDDGIVVTGRTNSDNNGDILGDTEGEDLWVFKLGGKSSGMDDGHLSNLQLAIYPNPIVDMLYFSEQLDVAEIYSMTGQKLIQNTNCRKLSIGSLSSGYYLLKTQTKDQKTSFQKIIKM